MSNSFTTHLGGTVTFTATGLIHKAGQSQYRGDLTNLNICEHLGWGWGLEL